MEKEVEEQKMALGRGGCTITNTLELYKLRSGVLRHAEEGKDRKRSRDAVSGLQFIA